MDREYPAQVVLQARPGAVEPRAGTITGNTPVIAGQTRIL